MTAAADSSPQPAGFRTHGRWLGPADRPLLGWLTAPIGLSSAGAALILPPVGYEYMTTHRTLRALAESLAGRGWTALRIDYDGTGDSAGDQWEGGRLAAWRASVAAGVDELRRLGFDDVSLIGIRLGATLALTEARAVHADRVVAWAPIVSGRRYVRELRMLGMPVEASVRCPDPDGSVTVGGFVFDASTIGELGVLDLVQLAAPPAESVLLIERSGGAPLGALAGRLTELGGAVDRRELEGSELCLDQPTEYATVPAGIVHEITEWVAAGASCTPRSVPARDLGDASPRDSADIWWDGAPVNETVATFTSRELVGIVGSTDEPARATVVWANPGSETHVGPGRAWVEYSRALNRRGYRTIRLDARGWGESPDDGYAPGRPYDAQMADDLRHVVAEVEARGWGPVVVAGLCAGAWIALDVARDTRFGGVVALNPQLYWQPGDPVEANIATETHVRREAERERIKRLARFGVWTLLDVLGVPNAAERWLRDVDARGTPALLLFSRGDDGLEYLEDRLGRALARLRRGGRIRLEQLPGIDHGMHLAWLRNEVVDAILGFLDDVAPVARSPRVEPTPR